MSDEKFKKVSEQEFKIFVRDYPKPLKFDWTGICHPPMISYNDFSLGDWPDSMVAKGFVNEGEEDKNEYYILRRYQ